MARNDDQDANRDITQQAFDSQGNPVNMSDIRAEDRDRLLGDMRAGPEESH